MVSDNLSLKDVFFDQENRKDLILLILAGLMIGLILIVAIQFFFTISSVMMSGLGLIWDLAYYFPAITGGATGGLWYFYYESRHSNTVNETRKKDALLEENLETNNQLGHQKQRLEQNSDKEDGNGSLMGHKMRISDYYFYMLILTFTVYLLELLSEGIPVFIMYFLISSGWIALLTFHVLKSFL